MTRPPLTTEAANAVFDAFVDILGVDEVQRDPFVQRQTSRYTGAQPLPLPDWPGQFVRGAWAKGTRTGETWAVTAPKAPKRVLKAVNERLASLQGTYIGAWKQTLRLSSAQWEMLRRFINQEKRNDPWVGIDGWDRRTYTALLSRGLVMCYPFGDSRPLAALTEEGRIQAYAHLRRQRWEERGHVAPGQGYR